MTLIPVTSSTKSLNFYVLLSFCATIIYFKFIGIYFVQFLKVGSYF